MLSDAGVGMDEGRWVMEAAGSAIGGLRNGKSDDDGR